MSDSESVNEPLAAVDEGSASASSGRSRHGRLRAFVLLRFTLIIASAYLLLEQTGFKSAPTVILVLLGLGVLSNLILLRLPARWTDSPWFSATVVIIDTVWITAALVLSGHFEPEFFYLYFLVLFLAAVGENLRLVVIGALVISAGYLFGLAKAHGLNSILTASSLMRIPFLFAVAAFYGYMVVRVRNEKRRAEREAETIVGLEKMQRSLREHSREVEQTRDDLKREVAVRSQVEDELRKLTSAVEQSPSMIIITDTDGVVEYVNSRFVSATGISWNSAVGQELRTLEGETTGSAPWKALRDEGAWEGECLVSPRTGEAFWAATSISHLVGENSEPEHCIVVQQDISDRKLAEETLRRANDELTRLNQLKSDFVSTVSHELRTPLTAIKNSIDLLSAERDPDEEMRERFFGIAKRNVDRLKALIEDLLDLSKLEAGKLNFEFKPIDIAKLLRDIFSTFESRAQQDMPHLSLEVSGELGSVWADPHRIEQVVVNLMSNAIKFTPQDGRVVLSAEGTDEGVDIAVTDTGIGISEDDRERVFERFYQAGESLTRTSRGTGLGLAIARDLVQLHGSDLKLDSEPGRGSRFEFTLARYSERIAEMASLEQEVWAQRIYPFFGMLVLEPGGDLAHDDEEAVTDSLETLEAQLRAVMPRFSDLFIAQPANRRLILLLVGTGREGSAVVREKLVAARADGRLPEGVGVLGPAVYPEDGMTARDLVQAALQSSDGTGA